MGTLIEEHNRKIAALTPEQRDVFEERAGIKEYDGHMIRLAAEAGALREIEK